MSCQLSDNMYQESANLQSVLFYLEMQLYEAWKHVISQATQQIEVDDLCFVIIVSAINSFATASHVCHSQLYFACN